MKIANPFKPKTGKFYRDGFGNPLPKSHVAAAIGYIIRTGEASAFSLTKQYGFAYVKSLRIIEMLEHAKVISVANMTAGTPRTVLLRNESSAINAALRQLRKGKPTK